MKKTIHIILFSLLLSNAAMGQFKMSEGSRKLATTMAFIENLYVDPVDDEKLAEDAIKSLLEKLDPHSTYISAADAKEMNEPLEGNFDGIGISFNMMTDTLYVIETISGGPSQRVGIMPGDRIIYVNDTLIAGVKMPTKDIMSRLRGKRGTIVSVKVKRRNTPELIDFKITRAKIPIYSIEASYMIDNHTGYIKISRFGATTTKEFQDACKALQNEGMRNLILDLENNGGGYLSAAIELADEFLEKDKLIVYTEGTHQPKQVVNATEKGLFQKGKLVILINEGSASASEIVSGAVQDWDRGVVVGRRSFGKGLVQRQLPFPDESILRLTVARYYTPTGRCIQKPYTNGDNQSYAMDVIERYNKGEMMNADSIHFPDSLKYTTLVNQRIVYGGGGIMPDYFVPLDTTEYSDYLRDLYANGIIQKIAMNEVDLRRTEILKKYPDVESFKNNFVVTDTLFDKLKSTKPIGGESSQETDSLNTETVKFNEKEFNRSKNLIAFQVKALMARDLYDTSSYYRIMNDRNEIFQKAIDIITNDERYYSLLRQRK